MTKLYKELANLVQAADNCRKTSNEEWLFKHTKKADQLVKERLPSGSGFDNGTTLDWDHSTPERLTLNTSFHHMEEGMYDGWTEHSVIITPSLVTGFDLRITGKDRNDIKDYISQCFHLALSGEHTS